MTQLTIQFSLITTISSQPHKGSKAKVLLAANDFISFINKSPSPFHAVDELKKKLVAHGFQELRERDTRSWKIEPSHKYFVTKNHSTIIAFAVGGQYKPGNGFSIVGAHTDSPCLKVKPISGKVRNGFCQVGVECYGGGIWNTWFDRDLTVAGRVIIQDGSNLVHRLVNVGRPILRIPHLAIHLQRDMNDSFGPNKETHLCPVLNTCQVALCHVSCVISNTCQLCIVCRCPVLNTCLCVQVLGHLPVCATCLQVSCVISNTCQVRIVPCVQVSCVEHLCPVLNTCVQAKLEGQPIGSEGVEGWGVATKHSPVLVKMLCEELGVAAENIVDFELCLADTQPAAIGGALEEFIFSPRLDNLLNAYCACQGLLESLSDGSLDKDPNVRMISLFDNEEVGSQSAQGAGSTFQELVMRRVCASAENSVAFEESIGKSYMISADQAHALHPNYVEKHESNHQPCFHKGVVVKFNANQSYATTAITTAILRQVAAFVKVPLQDFVVRNDSPCGSTIGPIMAAKLGMQTIDVGAPQLSMHSIREMGDTTSIVHCTDLFKGFFQLYPTILDRVQF
ncbi:hypothetical protein ACOMHN_054651 [Nucella lapillus]